MQDKLAQVPLFSSLAPAALEYLAQRLVPRTFHSGETLFEQGDAGNGLYLLESGVVRIYRVTAGGKEITLALRNAPDFVGEMSLLDGLPRSASACAQGGEVRAQVLRSEDLKQLLTHQPDASLVLLKVLSRRLREAGEQVEEMAFSTIQQRLASLLIRLSKAEGVDSEGHILLPPWVSYQSLSTMLGTARECVNRVAMELVEVGALDRRGRRLLVCNVDALEAIQHSVA